MHTIKRRTRAQSNYETKRRDSKAERSMHSYAELVINVGFNKTCLWRGWLRDTVLRRDLCQRPWKTSGWWFMNGEWRSLQCCLKSLNVTGPDVPATGHRPLAIRWSFTDSQYTLW